MGFRFRKSFSPVKGLRINFGRRGIGLSAGIRGLRFGVNSRGTYQSIGIPGTGISYHQQQAHGTNDSPGSSSALRIIAFFVLTFVAFCALSSVLSGNKHTPDPQANEIVAPNPRELVQPERLATAPGKSATNKGLHFEKPVPTPPKKKSAPNIQSAKVGCHEIRHTVYLRSSIDGPIIARVPAGLVVHLDPADGAYAASYGNKSGYLSTPDVDDAAPANCVDYVEVQPTDPVPAMMPERTAPIGKVSPTIRNWSGYNPSTPYFPEPVDRVAPSPSSGGGTVQVRGYQRKDGTYVQPYTRSAPRR